MIFGDYYAYDTPYAVKLYIRQEYPDYTDAGFNYLFATLYSVYDFPNIILPLINNYLGYKVNGKWGIYCKIYSLVIERWWQYFWCLSLWELVLSHLEWSYQNSGLWFLEELSMELVEILYWSHNGLIFLHISMEIASDLPQYLFHRVKFSFNILFYREFCKCLLVSVKVLTCISAQELSRYVSIVWNWKF